MFCKTCGKPVREGLLYCSGLSECWKKGELGQLVTFNPDRECAELGYELKHVSPMGLCEVCQDDDTTNVLYTPIRTLSVGEAHRSISICGTCMGAITYLWSTR